MRSATDYLFGDLFQRFVRQVGRTRHEFKRVIERAPRLLRNHRLCLAYAGGEVHGEFVRAHWPTISDSGNTMTVTSTCSAVIGGSGVAEACTCHGSVLLSLRTQAEIAPTLERRRRSEQSTDTGLVAPGDW